jgi:hypothetical protein
MKVAPKCAQHPNACQAGGPLPLVRADAVARLALAGGHGNAVARHYEARTARIGMAMTRADYKEPTWEVHGE